MIKSLKLFITVVLHEVDHILINIWKSWLSPLQRLHVDKAVQIVNTEPQVDSVARRHLYFILCDPWHAVRDMDPGASCLSSCFDNVKSISVMIHNFFALTVFFLSSLRSKDDRICSEVAATGHVICISLWVLNFISVHVFKLQCFPSVLHQLKTIGT